MDWKCSCWLLYRICPTKISHALWYTANTHSSLANNQTFSRSPTLAWVKPAQTWHKLNVDGSAKDNITAAEGIIINNETEWILGFTKFIRIGTALLVEAWALFTGLDLAHIIGTTKLKVETDSQELYYLFNEEYSNHHLSVIISNCRLHIFKFERMEISKIKRQQNLCANRLAKEVRKHTAY